MAITPRQRQVYDYVSRFIETQGQAPTMAELQSHFGLKSPSTVHHLLSGLEREGLIRRMPNIARGVEIIGVDQSDSAVRDTFARRHRRRPPDRSDIEQRNHLHPPRYAGPWPNVRPPRQRRFDDRRRHTRWRFNRRRIAPDGRERADRRRPD